MQFDFDSALMGYSAGQKFTSAGDAVVPSLTPRVSGYAQYPYNMQSTGSGFDKAAYDLSLKPLYEIPGTFLARSCGDNTGRLSLVGDASIMLNAGDGGASLGRGLVS